MENYERRLAELGVSQEYLTYDSLLEELGTPTAFWEEYCCSADAKLISRNIWISRFLKVGIAVLLIAALAGVICFGMLLYHDYKIHEEYSTIYIEEILTLPAEDNPASSEKEKAVSPENEEKTVPSDSKRDKTVSPENERNENNLP